MSPLTQLIALMFLLLVAFAAVVWWTITAPGRAGHEAREREARPERPPSPERQARPARPPRGEVSNDALRGARAPRAPTPVDRSAVRPPGEGGVTVRPRRRDDEDPFERFLDPERRRRDDGGR